MPSKDNENKVKPQELTPSHVERIETIEELLRARGFFDSVKPESNR
jgi:hypothetical protein